jgi:hypothetical protein
VLPGAELHEILNVLPLISTEGPWSRVVDYAWMEQPPPGATGPPQPLWPGGAAQRGARFNPPGGFGGIYFSEDPITAQVEAESIFASPGGSFFTIKRSPWVTLVIEGMLNRLLDLTDSSVQRRLGTTLAELTDDWRMSQDEYRKGKGPLPPTQLLGTAAYATGRIVGMRYRSARKTRDGVNVVVFPDRLIPDSHLSVFHGGSLSQRLP